MNTTVNKKGLTAKQLSVVFPYHMAVDSSFLITQIGTKLEKLFPKNEVTHQSIMIGQHIGNYFNVSSPPRFTWDWKRIKMSRDSTFNLEAIEEVIITTASSKPIKKLPLSGGIIISDPVEDSSFSEIGMFFLVNLRVRHSIELENYGFTFSDVSHFAFQKELILAGEHLRTEVNMSHKLEQISKNLEEEKIKTLKVLETKRSFVRYVSHEIRTPLNIVMMGLKYFEEMIERWQHRRSMSLLASVTPSAVVSSLSHRDSRGYSQPVSNRSGAGGSSRSHLSSSSSSPATDSHNTMQNMSTLPFSPSMTYIRDNTNYNSQHSFAVNDYNSNNNSSRKCSPVTAPPHIYTDDVSSSKYANVMSRRNSPSKRNKHQQQSTATTTTTTSNNMMVITNDSVMSALTSLTLEDINLFTDSNGSSSSSDANVVTVDRNNANNAVIVTNNNNTAESVVTVPKYTSRHSDNNNHHQNLHNSTNNHDSSHKYDHNINFHNNNNNYDSNDDYDVKEMASAITDMTSASSIAVDILNDLLLYEKIEGNLLTIEFDEVYVQDLILNVVQLFQLQANSKDISVSVDLTALSGVYVDADVSKFSQVLRNIMSNALKFTPQHGAIVVTAEVFIADDNYFNSSSSKKSDEGILTSCKSIMSNTVNNNNNSKADEVSGFAVSTSPPLPLLNLNSMKFSSSDSHKGNDITCSNKINYSPSTPHSSTGSKNNTNNINNIAKLSSSSSSSSSLASSPTVAVVMNTNSSSATHSGNSNNSVDDDENVSPLSPLRHLHNNNNNNTYSNGIASSTAKSRNTNDTSLSSYSSSHSSSFSPSAKSVIMHAMGVSDFLSSPSPVAASTSSGSGRNVRTSLGSYSGPAAVSTIAVTDASGVTDTSGSSSSPDYLNNNILTHLNNGSSDNDSNTTTAATTDNTVTTDDDDVTIHVDSLPVSPVSSQNNNSNSSSFNSSTSSIFNNINTNGGTYPPAVPIPIISSSSSSLSTNILRKMKSGSIGHNNSKSHSQSNTNTNNSSSLMQQSFPSSPPTAMTTVTATAAPSASSHKSLASSIGGSGSSSSSHLLNNWNIGNKMNYSSNNAIINSNTAISSSQENAPNTNTSNTIVSNISNNINNLTCPREMSTKSSSKSFLFAFDNNNNNNNNNVHSSNSNGGSSSGNISSSRGGSGVDASYNTYLYSHSPSSRSGGFNYPPTPLHNSFSNSNNSQSEQNNLFGINNNLNASNHNNNNTSVSTPTGSKGSGINTNSTGNSSGITLQPPSSPLISLSSSAKSTPTGDTASTPHSQNMQSSQSQQPLTSSWWRVSTLSNSAGRSGRNIGQSQSVKAQRRIARISIRDTGHGISLEDQRHLFQEFIQVRANKLQDGGGSGLGLWVARKIMEAHSGTIHVRSAGEGDQVTNPADRGSTFYIDIPVSRLEVIRLQQQQEQQYGDEVEVELEINDNDDEGKDGGSASSRSGYASSDSCSADGGSSKGKNSNSSNITQRLHSHSNNSANNIKRALSNNSISNTKSMKHSSRSYSIRSDLSNNSNTTTITTITLTQQQQPLTARLCPPELNHELLLMMDDHQSHSDTTSPAMMPAHFSSCVTRTIQSILIVDDSGMNRKMMSRLLSDKSALIHEACDGRDAIKKYLAFMNNGHYNDQPNNNPQHLPYDVIMMDFVMPVMNGPDCVRELRKIGCKGLIVGVTGNSTETDINAFLDAGVNRVMIKPLEVAKFMSFALAWVQRLG